MFHSKLNKRMKRLEKAFNDLAEHCGTWADFYDDNGVIGGGMRFGGREVKISDAVRALAKHLNLEIGVKAIEKPKEEK